MQRNATQKRRLHGLQGLNRLHEVERADLTGGNRVNRGGIVIERIDRISCFSAAGVGRFVWREPRR